jgi:citrate/tricarballylate utilization protein
VSLTDSLDNTAGKAVDLWALLDPEATDEVRRIMQICNACRYCEGFCAVFPAMERRRLFSEGDVSYLANLCHNCGACYHACQYAPPHEFGVNVPQAMAAARSNSYAAYAWPVSLAGLFHNNGMAVSVIIALGLAATVGVMLAMIAPNLFWGVHLGEGAFYQIMPHTVMAAIPLGITGFSVVAMIMGWRRYWRHTGAVWGGWRSFSDAVIAVAALRNLGGDNAAGWRGGAGCHTADDRSSNARRLHHQLTMYGFLLCFASTSVGTLYHYGFGWEAPYGLFELPVILGTVGGVILCVGTAGLFVEKRRMHHAVRHQDGLGMDYAFIVMLFFVSFTGLLLLALRSTSLMGLTLAIHLGFVYSFFLIMPYSKFVHGLYRFAALLASAEETQRHHSG